MVEHQAIDRVVQRWGELAGTLLPLIDRLVIKRNPLVFGSGVPMFGRGGSGVRAFERVSFRPFESGVVVEEWTVATTP